MRQIGQQSLTKVLCQSKRSDTANPESSSYRYVLKEAEKDLGMHRLGATMRADVDLSKSERRILPRFLSLCLTVRQLVLSIVESIKILTQIN